MSDAISKPKPMRVGIKVNILNEHCRDFMVAKARESVGKMLMEKLLHANSDVKIRTIEEETEKEYKLRVIIQKTKEDTNEIKNNATEKHI